MQVDNPVGKILKLYYHRTYKYRGKGVLYTDMKCNTYDKPSKCYRFCKTFNVVIMRIEGDRDLVEEFRSRYITRYNTIKQKMRG
jgi:hypothetical protein